MIKEMIDKNLKIINDKYVSKEIKLFCILDLLHEEDISLDQARKLCTKVNLFTEHWRAIFAKTVEVYIQTKDTTEKELQIIKDKYLSKEIKLFCILDLLNEEYISLNKARELCTEIGLFSDHWVVIDSKTREVYMTI